MNFKLQYPSLGLINNLKKMKYSVIIPIFDEAQTLKTLLKEIELLQVKKLNSLLLMMVVQIIPEKF